MECPSCPSSNGSNDRDLGREIAMQVVRRLNLDPCPVSYDLNCLAPLPPVSTWPSRRERILALAMDLSASIDTLDLDEVDGEFYWRVCRDDLTDALAQLATVIAPHIVGGDRNERFDSYQQDAIAEFNEFIRACSPLAAPIDGDLEAAEQRLVDAFKEQLQLYKLEVYGKAFIEQLPPFVWRRFSVGRRIPLRAPLEPRFDSDGKALEIRVYSRHLTGNDVESELEHWRGYMGLDPSLADAPSATVDQYLAELQVICNAERDPKSTSRIEIDVEITLVQDPPGHASSPKNDVVASPPCIVVHMRRPLPQKGFIGLVYDRFVRDDREWHLLLPGAETTQEKEVAIRTWTIGLLMKAGDSFAQAYRDLEARLGPFALTQEGDRQARQRLFKRVPEARPYLGAR